MDANEYQQLAKRTMAKSKDDLQLAVWGLGLAGETGEVVEHIKKKVGHGKPLPAAVIMDELGDVLFYAAAIAEHYGLRLSYIMGHNIAKLKRRYPDGFVEGGGIRDAN